MTEAVSVLDPHLISTDFSSKIVAYFNHVRLNSMQPMTT